MQGNTASWSHICQLRNNFPEHITEQPASSHLDVSKAVWENVNSALIDDWLWSTCLTEWLAISVKVDKNSGSPPGLWKMSHTGMLPKEDDTFSYPKEV